MGMVSDGVSFTNNGHHDQVNNNNEQENEASGGVTMTQNSRRSRYKKSDRRSNQELKCYNCGGVGHLLPQCPSAKQLSNKSKDNVEKNKEGENLFMSGLSTVQDYLEDLLDPNNAHTFNFFQMNKTTHSTYKEALLNNSVPKKQGTNNSIPDHWVLLDNLSTVDVFYNKTIG